ncbi:MAG: hypothetical protein WAV78_04685, partial [Xanthobacteraceae bacterium]
MLVQWRRVSVSDNRLLSLTPICSYCRAAVLRDELGHAVTPLRASCAFNPQRVQLTGDAEGEISSGDSRKLMPSSIRLLELRAHTALNILYVILKPGVSVWADVFSENR